MTELILMLVASVETEPGNRKKVNLPACNRNERSPPDEPKKPPTMSPVLLMPLGNVPFTAPGTSMVLKPPDCTKNPWMPPAAVLVGANNLGVVVDVKCARGNRAWK